eukprot:TRINITY_DN13072_c0_g1_i1.p3 TRINITY_DN13072_c0_g1~~TRINITY_DN13072_c0_g1_i1.p3  ORF type:complete len:104 (+),score=6.47 TRINITY_DN13072_c0_g1_i1:270-581(+)
MWQADCRRIPTAPVPWGRGLRREPSYTTALLEVLCTRNCRCTAVSDPVDTTCECECECEFVVCASAHARARVPKSTDDRLAAGAVVLTCVQRDTATADRNLSS